MGGFAFLACYLLSEMVFVLHLICSLENHWVIDSHFVKALELFKQHNERDYHKQAVISL